MCWVTLRAVLWCLWASDRAVCTLGDPVIHDPSTGLWHSATMLLAPLHRQAADRTEPIRVEEYRAGMSFGICRPRISRPSMKVTLGIEVATRHMAEMGTDPCQAGGESRRSVRSRGIAKGR